MAESTNFTVPAGIETGASTSASGHERDPVGPEFGDRKLVTKQSMTLCPLVLFRSWDQDEWIFYSQETNLLQMRR